MRRSLRALLEEAESRVRARLSAARLRHVEATARTAARLARRHGVSVDRVRLAAWLHDAAREMSLASMRRLMKGSPDPWDAGERLIPGLRHAKAGAALGARWGVKDREVLRAVANHTMGRPGMGRLEMILFVADFVEPGRRFPEARRARRIATISLPQAALCKASACLSWLKELGAGVHPRQTATRVWLERICRVRRPTAGPKEKRS